MRIPIPPIRPFLPTLLTVALIACSTTAPPPAAPSPATPSARATRPVIGVALGGGGARGFAEIGVLRVLEQERIPVDLIVGTSVGSLIAALYADTASVLDAEFLAVEVNEEDLFDYRAFSFLSGGFVKGERLERFITSHLKAANIEDMRIPYTAVAVDLKAGRTVPFSSGPVARAVHASCAIPGVFTPVEIDGVTYVDGGVTDPVPADVARERGADVVIAVAIPAEVPKETPRTPLGIAFRATTVMSAEIGRLRAREADVVIQPDVSGVRYDDFSQKKRLIAAGEAAARAALPEIRAAIAAKTKTAR